MAQPYLNMILTLLLLAHCWHAGIYVYIMKLKHCKVFVFVNCLKYLLIPGHRVGRGLLVCNSSVRQSVCLSFRPSVTFRIRTITYVCIDGLPSNFVQMLSSLRRCAYSEEYLDYNNLYFLFSHSWPVVVYNFGQVQHTSQVERNTKCSKKNNVGDIAFLWTAL